MAEALKGKYTKEKDNNNRCFVNDKDNDDNLKIVQSVIKFEKLDREFEFPNLQNADKQTAQDENNFRNNINHSLTLSQCNKCCTEPIPIPIPDNNNEAVSPLPPAIQELIMKKKKSIAKIDFDATISAGKKNFDMTVAQEKNVAMDHDTSWVKDFELKLSDESNDDLENNENHDSNNDGLHSAKAFCMDTELISPKECFLEITRTSYTEDHDTTIQEVVVNKDEKNLKSTDKSVRQEEEIPNKIQKSTNLLNNLSCDSEKLSREIENSVDTSKNEDTTKVNINLPSDVMANIFNAKVVLEKLPASLQNSRATTTKKVLKFILPRPRNTTEKILSPKFSRYCSKCKRESLIDDDKFRQNDNPCIKCKKNLLFKCVNCAKRFPNLDDMLHHLNSKCDAVDNKTTVKSVKSTPTNKEITITNFNCPKCEKQFKRQASLKSHLLECKADCDKNNDASVKSKTKSGLIELSCPSCNKSVNKFISVRCVYCGGRLEFSCKKCQDIFSKYDCVAYHVESNSCSEAIKEESFHCPDCVRVSSSGSKNCHLCPYKANAVFNLIRHLQLHHTRPSSAASNESRLVCGTCGNNRFANKGTYTGHVKRCGQLDTPRFKCKLCDYVTTFVYNIRRHMSTVHAQKLRG